MWAGPQVRCGSSHQVRRCWSPAAPSGSSSVGPTTRDPLPRAQQHPADHSQAADSETASDSTVAVNRWSEWHAVRRFSCTALTAGKLRKTLHSSGPCTQRRYRGPKVTSGASATEPAEKRAEDSAAGLVHGSRDQWVGPGECSCPQAIGSLGCTLSHRPRGASPRAAAPKWAGRSLPSQVHTGRCEAQAPASWPSWCLIPVSRSSGWGFFSRLHWGRSLQVTEP